MMGRISGENTPRANVDVEESGMVEGVNYLRTGVFRQDLVFVEYLLFSSEDVQEKREQEEREEKDGEVDSEEENDENVEKAARGS